MANIIALHRDLANGTYRHGGYEHFKISDPKPRDIHKASVRDRLMHHALYRRLYPFFDRTFIADSYSCRQGLPLGNLTSQLFVNIYLNELDQFAKHKFKARYYIRYADDFVLLSFDRNYLLKALPYMEVFLRDTLKLALHPDKVSIKTLASGVDFLGWVHFPDHRVLRTSTKRRMFRRIAETNGNEATVRSYLGLLGWGNARKLQSKIALALPSGGR